MKNHIIYQLALGTKCGYNEETNKFDWLSIENATKYTESEANTKKAELLQPFIDQYQSTGKNYQEIYTCAI